MPRETETKSAVQVTREELYRQLWTTPMNRWPGNTELPAKVYLRFATA
jgi:hypothetical protein